MRRRARTRVNKRFSDLKGSEIPGLGRVLLFDEDVVGIRARELEPICAIGQRHIDRARLAQGVMAITGKSEQGR
jgi:hypothetical protein